MGIFSELLALLSGGKGEVAVSEQLLFDKVIGFKGIVDGCGASTLVQNVACALSDNTKYKICVVDTSMLYPCQHELLGSSDDTPDILDFARGMNFGEIVNSTSFSNVYTVGFKDRTVVDLVAVTEDTNTFDKLLDELKKFYDVILIDLSHEPSNFATEAAIKCNKIFMVCDTSMKATSNIVKAYNYITTLGVSLTKCKRVILNKTINIASGVNTILDELRLEKFGEIPYSDLIYKQGVTGKPFYGLATRDAGITEAHVVLGRIVNDIIEKSPVNEKNLKKKKNKKKEDGVQEVNFDADETAEEENVKQSVDVPVVYSDHNPYANIKEKDFDESEPVFSEEVDS